MLADSAYVFKHLSFTFTILDVLQNIGSAVLNNKITNFLM